MHLALLEQDEAVVDNVRKTLAICDPLPRPPPVRSIMEGVGRHHVVRAAAYAAEILKIQCLCLISI